MQEKSPRSFSVSTRVIFITCSIFHFSVHSQNILLIFRRSVQGDSVCDSNDSVIKYVRIESKRGTRVIEIKVHVMQFLVSVEVSEVTLGKFRHCCEIMMYKVVFKSN